MKLSYTQKNFLIIFLYNVVIFSFDFIQLQKHFSILYIALCDIYFAIYISLHSLNKYQI